MMNGTGTEVMEYFSIWLTLSGLGILFGLFPGYGSTAGILYEAVLLQRKKPPRWMYDIFFIDVENPEVTLWARGPRGTRKTSWYVSIAYVILILGFYHYIGRVDYLQGDIIMIIIGETSFPALDVLRSSIEAFLISTSKETS